MSNLSKRLCGSIGIALIWAVMCLNEPNEIALASCALLSALLILFLLCLTFGYFDK